MTIYLFSQINKSSEMTIKFIYKDFRVKKNNPTIFTDHRIKEDFNYSSIDFKYPSSYV